jgi:ubiquinone/menaquinone biosynthesis C-methylase UbiE
VPVVPDREHTSVVREEFERAAPVFARRTAGRFDHLDVPAFSRVRPGETVIEVGAGTGNFLSLFAPVASRLVACDLTPGMLRVAREGNPRMLLVAGNGARLPFDDGSIELVTSAHAMHHIPEPVPVLREMRRVTRPEGRVLVVDLAAPEDPDEAARADEVMTIRDPSHATSLTVGALREALTEAGLKVTDERVVDRRGKVSNWMWPGEFPEDRIASVREYVARHWNEIGMDLQPEGDDFSYRDRRMLFLAVPV